MVCGLKLLAIHTKDISINFHRWPTKRLPSTYHNMSAITVKLYQENFESSCVGADGRKVLKEEEKVKRIGEGEKKRKVGMRGRRL